MKNLLRKPLDTYPPKNGFQYHDLSNERLWLEVRQLSSRIGRHPEREGWLRYVARVPEIDEGGVKRSVRKIWNVKDGAHLGIVLQMHAELFQGNKPLPLKLEHLSSMYILASSLLGRYANSVDRPMRSRHGIFQRMNGVRHKSSLTDMNAFGSLLSMPSSQ